MLFEQFRRRSIPSTIPWMLLAAVMLLPTLATAQEAGEEDLPEGRAIYDEYVAASGGQERLDNMQSVHIQGTLSMGPMSAPIEIKQARPNKLKVNVEIENVGAIQQGSNGEHAWDLSPMTGPRLLEGKRKDELMRRADFELESKPDKYYESMTTVGKAEVDGKPCYAVEFALKDGATETRFYDLESKMLVKTEAEADTPMGKLMIITKFSDYRDVNGSQVAYKTVISANGQERTILYDNVKYNLTFDEHEFDPPEVIAKIIEKKAAKAEQAEPATAP